jgi:hypothetical protein
MTQNERERMCLLKRARKSMDAVEDERSCFPPKAR